MWKSTVRREDTDARRLAKADDDGEHERHREELGVAPHSSGSGSFREVDEGGLEVQFPRSGELEGNLSSKVASRCCHDARQSFRYFSSGNRD
jgi:hypothetical protein